MAQPASPWGGLPWRRYADAIAAIESRGSGDYGALGPQTRRGDRAYGRYQVMGANIPSWTERHLGRRLTPEQFLADRDAQDRVFQGEFGGYLSRFGRPEDAASMWFTGRPYAGGRRRRDVLGTTGENYVGRFMAGLGNTRLPDFNNTALGRLIQSAFGGVPGMPGMPSPMGLGMTDAIERESVGADLLSRNRPLDQVIPPARVGAGPGAGIDDADAAAGMVTPFRPTAGRVGSPWQAEVDREPFTTSDVLDLMPSEYRDTTGGASGTVADPAAFGAARLAAARGAGSGAAAAAPPGPGYFERLMYNPAFLAGLSILGTAPGGNWGPAGAQAATSALRSRREQSEYERQQRRRSVMDRVWAAAFPGGQANTTHPLLLGIPPEMAQAIFAMGPETGLPQLQRFAFFRAKLTEQERLRQARAAAIARLIPGLGADGTSTAPPETGEPPPTIVPTGEVVAPGVTAGAGADLTAAAPPPAGPGAAPPPSGTTFSPLERSALFADLMGNRLESLEALATAERAPERAGRTKLAQERAVAEARRPQVRRQMADTLSSLDRLSATAERIANSPALPSTVGSFVRFRNVVGSPEYDLAREIETLRSGAALRQLQSLRESAGPGGGSGLGALNETEFRALQDSIANLDENQSAEAFRRRLQQIIDYARRARSRAVSAYEEQYGAWTPPGGASDPDPPSAGADGFRIRRLD